jgi:hypothetical protein
MKPTTTHFDYVTDKLGGSLDQIKAHLIKSGAIQINETPDERAIALRDLLSNPRPFRLPNNTL